MNSVNLGTIFGPHLLRPNVSHPNYVNSLDYISLLTPSPSKMCFTLSISD